MCAKEAEQLRLQGVPYLGAAKYGFHCNYETAAIRLSRTIVYWSSFKMYFEVSQFQKLTFGAVYCEPSPKYSVNLKDQFTAHIFSLKIIALSIRDNFQIERMSPIFVRT